MRRRRGLAALLLVLVLVLVGCSSDSETTGGEDVTFPPGFLWGSASAAFQVEKGLPNTDWSI